MKLWKGILLGSSAGLASAAAGHATDLPAFRAAPVEYVRICDAYGAGFFFIPGTDRCLEIGGSVLGNTTAAYVPPYRTTSLDRAFLQFGELTAGRTQSFFDFYADAYNFMPLRGSNATAALLAYTATFGDGFSVSLSFEDQASRRAAVSSTIAASSATGPLMTVTGIASGSLATPGSPAVLGGFQGAPADQIMPDAVGDVSLDQPWGATLFAAAAHQVKGNLFSNEALQISPTQSAFAAAMSNSYGFAALSGLQLNLDYLPTGDKLWLQAAYEKGAYGSIAGNNPAFAYGAFTGNKFYGSALSSLDYGYGWNPRINADCVWTGSPSCQRSGSDVTAANRHYWLPTLSSSVFGSYQDIHYSPEALAGFGGAVGLSNLTEIRSGTSLVWAPIKSFNIGAEFPYINLNQTRPVGPAPDLGPASTTAAGLPKFQGNTSEYEGRLRVQRAF